MHPLVLAQHHARGLGNYGVHEELHNFGINPTFPTSSGGNWYSKWGQGVIGQAGQILTGIFGNRGNNNAALLQQQQALLAAQQAAARGNSTPRYDESDDRDSDDGIGIRFTDKGLRLGEKTTISYSTMMIGAVVVFLIQSPGFQRRGR